MPDHWAVRQLFPTLPIHRLNRAPTRRAVLAAGATTLSAGCTVDTSDAMDIDDLKSPALYFGTTTGQLWIGREGGEKWECLFDALPPIHCVKAAVV